MRKWGRTIRWRGLIFNDQQILGYINFKFIWSSEPFIYDKYETIRIFKEDSIDSKKKKEYFGKTNTKNGTTKKGHNNKHNNNINMRRM